MIDLSVIIPTYNSEKHIKDCLDSLKNQDYRNFQVLLADGGSTDNTIKIIKKYKFNLKIVSKKDSSPEEGINKGLKKVNTNFFCILMSDDLMYQKNYFSKLIHILKHNKADVAFPNFGSIVGKKKGF